MSMSIRLDIGIDIRDLGELQFEYQYNTQGAVRVIIDFAQANGEPQYQYQCQCQFVLI